MYYLLFTNYGRATTKRGPFFSPMPKLCCFLQPIFRNSLGSHTKLPNKAHRRCCSRGSWSKIHQKKMVERKPPPGKMEKKQEPQQIHHLYQQISNAVKCIFCVKKQMNLQPHKDDVSESLASNCPGCQDVKNDINPCNC